ncbi:HIT family protein [Candidatus Woesearchaeota archaeon]|nr:HIT family protein [Candidatus Woesearchaeota archaeon]
MPGCELCLAIREKELVLFEDPHSVVILHPHGAVPGHLLVIPRVHYGIMEQMPDEDLRQLFRVTKLMATSLEKGIGTKELNVIITNGPAAGQEFPHFSIHIIPRGKGDTVKMGWEPASVSKSDMDTIEVKLKEACRQFKRVEEKREVSEEPIAIPKESYQIKHVRRIP